MSRLGPDEIPDDTTGRGLLGWIGESLARGLMLRLGVIAAFVCALLGLVIQEALGPGRVTAIAVGVVGLMTLLVSQLFAWPRRSQWLAILAVLSSTGGLLVYWAYLA